MRFKYGTRLLATGLLLGLNAVSAQAALFDRGGGLIYDDVLNVTWLQDANYAKTSEYDADGLMTWDQAQTWAASLVYHDSVRNIDYGDWRLPGGKPVNGTAFNYGFSLDGSTDGGNNYSFNITSPNSELAYLLNVELQNPNYYLPTGYFVQNPNWTGTPNATFQDASHGNTANTFSNLKSYFYWTGTEYLAPGAGTLNAWAFSTETGYQFSSQKNNFLYAWAVRDGDVATVPVPGAIWLFGSGLLGLVGLKRSVKTA